MPTKALLVCTAVGDDPGSLARKAQGRGTRPVPLGYVNTLGTTCVYPFTTVAPTYGKACQEGWMNIGAGCCRRGG